MRTDNAQSRHLFDPNSNLGRRTEVLVAVVVVLSLISLTALTTVREASSAELWLNRIETSFLIFFAVEYLSRLLTAPKPLRYAFSFYGIIDLIAALAGVLALGALASLKTLRLLRVMRVLKLARYSAAVDRFSRAFDDIKDELALYTGVTAVISFIAAYGIWLFEHETNEAYGNLFECVYWSVASLTMGAEGIAPETTAGKILAMCLVLLGLGIVAVPSGLLASALSKTDPDNNPTDTN